jgi:RHS repeat-associated protein
VANRNGNVVQQTHYYPFGLTMGISDGQGAQPYKYTGKELDMEHGLMQYDFQARQYDPTVGRFMTMDPLAEKYYSVSPYAYCLNNPVRFVDPDGMAVYIMFGDGRIVLALADQTEKDKMKPDQLYAAQKDKDGNISKLGDPLKVNDKSLLPQLAGGKNSAAAETSNSSDAFGVFKFAADNSSPEWSLKGYETEGGRGFLLSTSYDPDQVTSGNGSYDPAKLIFALHSHPDGTDNIGPSGSITKVPLTTDKYDINGDIKSMYNRQLKSPNSRHYIYHEGTKKLIYYDWYTAINKRTQNERGRSKGVVNSGSQMRKKILGY